MGLAGNLLVGLQFLLVGLIVWPFGIWRLSGSFWLLIAAGVVLGAYTLAHNRIGNFNIRPQPKATAKLITSGPYALIRHPMYSALLLGAAAFVIAEGSYLKIGLWLALAMVLLIKSRLEERLMAQRFSEYADYRANTKRFVPFVL